jgi:hypothetical protein
MLIDIDVHHLARIAHSLSEMDKLLKQGSKSYPHLCRVFAEHKDSCYFLANVVSEAQCRKTDQSQKGGGE